MKEHQFIFIPGVWLGQGTVEFHGEEARLTYYTRWKIRSEGEKVFVASQEVELQGGSEKVVNHYRFSKLSLENFSVELAQEAIGEVVGIGHLEASTLTWEFHKNQIGFTGQETFERKGEDRYINHAEFKVKDELFTIIRGEIWRDSRSK